MEKNENMSSHYSNNNGVSFWKVLFICVTSCLMCCIVFLYFHNLTVTHAVIINQSTVTVDSVLTSKPLVETIADIRPAVVELRCQTSPTTISAGSGVVIGREQNTDIYYILTNFHVIYSATIMKATLFDGETVLTASLVGGDDITDIAVVKIDMSGVSSDLISVAEIGNSGTLRVGETAIAIGNPLGQLGGTVTTGIISALDREIMVDGQKMTLLQTNAQVNSGNSGGGLFNEIGQLVGIVNAKSSGTGIEGIGFAIPINNAIDIASQLINTHSETNFGYIAGRVKIGAELFEVNSDNSYQYVGYGEGVYIGKLLNNSDIENAGGHVNDRIATINGQTITEIAQIKEFMADKQIGDTIVMTLVRNNFHTIGLTFQLTQYVYQI